MDGVKMLCLAFVLGLAGCAGPSSRVTHERDGGPEQVRPQVAAKAPRDPRIPRENPISPIQP